MATSQHNAQFEADALIVLANLMDQQGNLNPLSRARMDAAVDAFLAKRAPHIITTGWAYRGDSDIIIAHAMRDYAVHHRGVAPEHILCEPHARDTVGDAVFTKRNLVNAAGWQRLLVVTSDYHAARTREIFAFIYGPGYSISVLGSPDDKGESAVDDERNSLAAFHTTFANITPGDDAAIYERMLAHHPFYNGILNPKF